MSERLDETFERLMARYHAVWAQAPDHGNDKTWASALAIAERKLLEFVVRNEKAVLVALDRLPHGA